MLVNLLAVLLDVVVHPLYELVDVVRGSRHDFLAGEYLVECDR